jgi:ribulose-phosphate 3-epimerase
LGEQVAEMERSGLADWVHIDVMDGVFVPNLTIGPVVVAAIKRYTKLPLDVHLMIVEPGRYIDQFAEAGADMLTVHVEACPHIHRDLEMIKRKGLKAGVSLNPGTPVNSIEEVLPAVDLALVMTVDPGFGGQAFLPETLPKIRQLRTKAAAIQREVNISVDGGINAETAALAVQAGANVLIAGSAVFSSKHSIQEGIHALRQSLNK